MEHRWPHVNRCYFVRATLKVNEIFRGWQCKDVRFVVVFLLIISAGSVGGGMDIEYVMTAAQCVRWKDICVWWNSWREGNESLGNVVIFWQHALSDCIHRHELQRWSERMEQVGLELYDSKERETMPYVKIRSSHVCQIFVSCFISAVTHQEVGGEWYLVCFLTTACWKRNEKNDNNVRVEDDPLL